MTKITEEQGLHKAWYEEAEKVSTPDELAAFVRRLLTDYEHDYGTICHAVAAAAIAGANAVNRDPKQGGITGFQAGAVFWEFARAWNRWPADHCGARMIEWGDLLYPQSDPRMTSIPRGAWEALITKASKLLASGTDLHPNVARRVQMIASGNLPLDLTVQD